MKKQLPLLVLVVALFTIVWILRPAGDDDDAPVIDATTSADEVEAPPDGLAEAEVHAPDSERVAATSVPLYGTMGGDELPEMETFELEGAVWVDVTVRLPEGDEHDPTLLLVALYPGPGSDFGDHELNLMKDQLSSFVPRIVRAARDGRAREEILFVWTSRRVPESGVLRIPAPAAAPWGLLAISGRFLQQEGATFELSVADLPVVFEPVPGAWLTGRIHLPPEAAGRGVDHEDFDVNAYGRPRDERALETTAEYAAALDPSFRFRRADVYHDLSFELRGLNTSALYSIEVQADKLLDTRREGIDLAPGEHRVLEIALEPGASITGVVRGEDGEAVANASVRGRIMIDRRRDSWHGDRSDGSGAYALHGMPPGEVDLEASADGWEDSAEVTVVLAEGEIAAGVDLVLPRGDLVGGEVVWEDGTPAAGAWIEVFSPVGGRWRDGKNLEATGEADEQGRFLIGGLDADSFEIHAYCLASPTEEELAEGGRGHRPARYVHLEAPRRHAHQGLVHRVESGTLDARIVLAAPLSFPGIVVDDVGDPVPRFAIEAMPARDVANGYSPEQMIAEFEVEDGRFLFGGLYAEEWSATAMAEGYSDMGEGVRVTVPHEGDPIVITLRRLAGISGVVLDPAGVPVAEASVIATGEGPPEDIWDGTEIATTGEDGRFDADDVQPIGLALVARHDDWADSEPVAVLAEPGQPLADIVLRLRVGARITGEVYDAEGDPVAGRAVTCGIGMLGMGETEHMVLTDGDGRFAFEHVTPGKVTVMAMPSPGELMAAEPDFETQTEEEIEQAAMDMLGRFKMETVEVADGEEVHVILGKEQKAPVRIFGRVTEGGGPLTEGAVLAFKEGGSLIDGLKLGRIDAQGNYEVTVDRPGEYVLNVSREGLEGGPGTPFPVDVPAGTELRVDLALPLGSIAGRVIGRDGAPAEGIELRVAEEYTLFGLQDLDDPRSAISDLDGSFSFGTLVPGTYSVYVGAGYDFEKRADTSYGAVVVPGIRVGKDEAVTGVEIRLVGAGELTGVVRDAADQPVAGAAIFVRDGGGRLITNVSRCLTDAVGRYRYPGIAPGGVTVCARKDELTCEDHGPVTITEGGETSLDLELAEGAMLEITTLVDDEPVRARVRVLDAGGRRIESTYSAADLEAMFTEGFSTKVLSVGPLPPGEYRVIVTTADGKKAERSVRVRAGQTTRKVKMRPR